MVCVCGGGKRSGEGKKSELSSRGRSSAAFLPFPTGKEAAHTGCCFVPGASATLATEAPSGPLEKFCSWVGRGGMKPTTLEHFSASASPSGCLLHPPLFFLFSFTFSV